MASEPRISGQSPGWVTAICPRVSVGGRAILTDIKGTGTALLLQACRWVPSPSSHPLCPWHPLLLTATLQAVLGASPCALWEIVPLPLPPTTALLIVYIAVC